MNASKSKTPIRRAGLAILYTLSAIAIVSCASKPGPTASTKPLENGFPLSAMPQTNAAPSAKPPNKNYYTCAMHPEVHSHDPDGKCPICGMPLMPASEISDEPTNQ
jgi:hypothetical protein